MTQRIRGRFRLTAVTPIRTAYSVQDPEANGGWRHLSGQAAKVEMFAVTDDAIFSKATPYGKIEMHVTDPSAAETFSAAWHAYVADPDPKAQAPEFFVDFTPAEE